METVVGVSEDEILDAMQLLMTRAKLYVEGSGAAATAAIIHRKVALPAGANVVSLVSGGNLDLEQLVTLTFRRRSLI